VFLSVVPATTFTGEVTFAPLEGVQIVTEGEVELRLQDPPPPPVPAVR
jgi:hypothetical protein